MATSGTGAGRQTPGREAGARWGVILAGGDGTRLRALTRDLVGDERPKQFCPILGDETLLDETRHRVALSLSPLRTLVVLTRHHEAYYGLGLADAPPHRLVVQPENRGTAPAILYALARIGRAGATDAVAIFPSDHYVSSDEAFMAHVDAAFEVLADRPDLIVLLGVTPDRPEPEFGWIDPGDPVSPLHRTVRTVTRFWEKPPPALAEELRARGGLWNSFVMVGRVETFLALIHETVPELSAAFAGVRPVLGSPTEAGAIAAVYRRLPSTDFSRRVLGARPGRLAVVPVRGVDWNDLGSPERVHAARGLARGRGPARFRALTWSVQPQ